MKLEQLLAPFPSASADGSHCGDDLSFDSAFDTIQELRREDDPTLSQGAWVRELKRADWPGVVALGTTLTIERTKDLRVAGWGLDAAARVSGYAGLADGLELVEGLCTRYWPEVHPRAEGGEWDLRIGNLSWLLGRVESMAKAAPFMQSGEERYGLADVAMARQREPGAGQVDETAQDRARRERDERVMRCLRALGAPELAELAAHTKRARAALGSLEVVVDRELGQDGPAFGGARQALDDAVHAFERLLREAGGGAVLSTAAAAVTTTTATTGDRATGTTSIAVGSLSTRAQALAQLRLVADFFRRTEPHSPVAYLADKAAHWGEMPLHTWLRSVMREPLALAHLEELLGVEPPRERE
jgi:type VI secretion system protein ImpA